MSATPEIEEVPVTCVKVSAEEAKRQMEETTKAELAKLTQLMKTQKIPERRDIMSENDSDSESDYSSSDEDYVPSKRKRISPSQSLQVDVESKMYVDNQNLWKKIHKYGLELHRSQKELHYMQLELNNKCIEYNTLELECKKIDEYKERCATVTSTKDLLIIFLYAQIFINALFIIDYASNHKFFPFYYYMVVKLLKYSVVTCVKLVQNIEL